MLTLTTIASKEGQRSWSATVQRLWSWQGLSVWFVDTFGRVDDGHGSVAKQKILPSWHTKARHITANIWFLLWATLSLYRYQNSSKMHVWTLDRSRSWWLSVCMKQSWVTLSQCPLSFIHQYDGYDAVCLITHRLQYILHEHNFIYFPR